VIGRYAPSTGGTGIGRPVVDPTVDDDSELADRFVILEEYHAALNGHPALLLRRIRHAHASWANTVDRAARTASGTKAFLDSFERQVDPDGLLPAEARQAMARHARTAYMLQLAESP
jgi:hypothetical protein